MTYRQAQTKGYQVRRGEKGTQVQYWRLRPILGEHGFSEDRLQDTVGIKPPKLVD